MKVSLSSVDAGLDELTGHRMAKHSMNKRQSTKRLVRGVNFPYCSLSSYCVNLPVHRSYGLVANAWPYIHALDTHSFVSR